MDCLESYASQAEIKIFAMLSMAAILDMWLRSGMADASQADVTAAAAAAMAACDKVPVQGQLSEEAVAALLASAAAASESPIAVTSSRPRYGHIFVTASHFKGRLDVWQGRVTPLCLAKSIALVAAAAAACCLR